MEKSKPFDTSNSIKQLFQCPSFCQCTQRIISSSNLSTVWMGEVLSPLQQTMKRHCFFVRSPRLAACKAIGAPGQAQCWLHRDFDHPQWRPRTCGACGESWRIWSLHIFTIFSSFSLSESKHTAYSACHPSIYSLTKCLMSWHVLNMCKFRTDALPFLGRGLTENLLHWISYFLLRVSKMIWLDDHWLIIW